MSGRADAQPLVQAPSKPRIDVDADPGRPDVVWLDNGILRLGAVPELGGRLLSVQVQGKETLWHNPELLDEDLHPVAGHIPRPQSGSLADWTNYGGDKTWPAPQGWSGSNEWAGPPDPVLDSGPYHWVAEQDADGVPGALQVTMTSADDPQTGLRLERRVTLPAASSSYVLNLSATNTSERLVRWSLWNVTQRRSGEIAEGGVDVGVGLAPRRGCREAPDIVTVLAGTGAPAHVVTGEGRLRIPHQDVVGKVGFPTATGWIAHVANGTTCTLRFDVDAHATYPDGGARAEVWLEHPQPEPLTALGDLDPPDRIVEIEVLSPLVDLPPGEHTSLQITFGAIAEQAEAILDVTATGHRTPAGWRRYTHEEIS